MPRGVPIPNKVRKAVRERSEGLCEIGLPRYCTRTATEMHHKKSRGRGGSNDPDLNILHACNGCHWAITNHKPGTAKYRTHSWQKEGENEANF